MTYDEIEKILNSHCTEYCESKVKDKFLEGLKIISSLSTKRNYACEHDKFYASDIDDIPDLKKDDVVNLNRLGWGIDLEYQCWCKNL